MDEQQGRSPADTPLFSRIARVAAPITLGLTLLAGCVGGGGDGDGGSQGSGDGSGKEKDGGGKAEPLASSESTILKYPLRIDITKLDRTADDAVFLSFSVTNIGDSEEGFYSPLYRRDDSEHTSPSNVTLIDTKNKKQHLPHRIASGNCYCESWDDSTLSPNETLDIWVAFPAPPADVKTMTVAIPIAAPFLDIPLASGEAVEEPPGNLDEPRIVDLLSREEELDNSASREDSGDETSLLLSSDVLFDVDESELTSKADTKLEEVAKEIDAAKGTTVTIDGYTDSSGNDRINDPLSEDRAASVEKKLKDLVTRSGVTFESAGHGSDDPVASNDTDAGKQKNRRVTVTFKN